jgi:hypothetical protein
MRRPSMLEQAENARWMRVQAEQCRASAYSTSEPDQRYSYIQLAECYEAQASECEAGALLTWRSEDGTLSSNGLLKRNTVPGALL